MRFPQHSFVQVIQEIRYDYGEGEPSCTLAAGYEGQVVRTDSKENVLVRFNARDPSGDTIGDRWVLKEDLFSLKPFVDTSKAPYEDHGDHGAGMTTQAQMQPPPEPAPRLTNPAQLAPIFFVFCTIVFLYIGYVYGHCVRLMQLNETPKMVNQDDRFRGYLCFAICSFATLMIVISYLRAIFTHPGTIPTEGPDAPYWDFHADADKAKEFEPKFLEKKTKGENGGRRHCKWCRKFKPDRCHHCKVCGMCILKMDHHCPWIYNCVGFHNYKYFFLLLLYAVIDTHLIVWTMSDSVAWYMEDGASFRRTFMALFCVTLAASLSIILTLFWLFHVWLMFKGLTTIEFCEKQTKGPDAKDPKEATFGELIFGDVYRSNFSRGPLANVRAVLGDWTILWLLPVCPPSGNGLIFADQKDVESEYGAVKQARSMETNRGLYVRRSANKKRDKHKQREFSWV